MATFFSVVNSLEGRSDLTLVTNFDSLNGNLTVVNDNVAILSPVSPDGLSAVLPLENIQAVIVPNI